MAGGRATTQTLEAGERLLLPRGAPTCGEFLKLGAGVCELSSSKAPSSQEVGNDPGERSTNRGPASPPRSAERAMAKPGIVPEFQASPLLARSLESQRNSAPESAVCEGGDARGSDTVPPDDERPEAQDSVHSASHISAFLPATLKASHGPPGNIAALMQDLSQMQAEVQGRSGSATDAASGPTAGDAASHEPGTGTSFAASLPVSLATAVPTVLSPAATLVAGRSDRLQRARDERRRLLRASLGTGLAPQGPPDGGPVEGRRNTTIDDLSSLVDPLVDGN